MQNDGNYEHAEVVRSFQIAANPSPSPSQPLGTYYTLSLVQASGGTATSTPGPGQYLAGTVSILTATPGPGQVFTGWLVDGTLRSYAATVQLILSGNRVVAPAFAAQPNLGDVPANSESYAAISQLAARGLYLGYGNNRYGPNDTTQRAQMAALIVRSMGWGAEDYLNPFTDQNGLDPGLWRNVGTLAHYGVARGYAPGDCAVKRRAYPCFGPTEPVTYAETVTFITRAMVAKGYWQIQAGAQPPYSGVPAVFAPEVATFYYYTRGYGGIPAAPATTSGWSAQATRGWFARVLWVALLSQYGGDLIP
jgi:Divergent InlB B-repeat domain/S-layer homology domain